jgi:hypothetical protein
MEWYWLFRNRQAGLREQAEEVRDHREVLEVGVGVVQHKAGQG